MVNPFPQFSQTFYTKAVLCVRNPLVDTSGKSEAELAKDSQDMMKTVLKASSSQAQMKLALKAGLGMKTKYNFIEVQYNPATVVVSSSGGKYMSMDRSGTIGSASASNLIERNQPVQKRCSFTIIVDDVDENDAFGFSGNTSLTFNNVAGMGKGIYDTLSGNKHSVKEKCEALMGLVMESNLRDMVFCYGKMAFHGELVSCQTKYTMFNLKGNPIRAEIRMTLFQLADSDRYKYDVQEWRQKWQKAFKTGI